MNNRSNNPIWTQPAIDSSERLQHIYRPLPLAQPSRLRVDALLLANREDSTSKETERTWGRDSIQTHCIHRVSIGEEKRRDRKGKPARHSQPSDIDKGALQGCRWTFISSLLLQRRQVRVCGIIIVVTFLYRVPVACRLPRPWYFQVFGQPPSPPDHSIPSYFTLPNTQNETKPFNLTYPSSTNITDRRPSPGLRLDLASNNPFRNRAASPASLPGEFSASSPFYTPPVDQTNRLTSRNTRNPFFDDSEEVDIGIERSALLSLPVADSATTMLSSQQPAVFSHVTQDMVSFFPILPSS